MKLNRLTKLLYGVLCALVLAVMIPATAMGQRRWVVVRPHRSRVVVYNYQPRPRYTYQTYTYGYPQSYYSTYYSNGYGYTEPYYSSPYYSYRYSQPYFANRYAYSWANPTYRYNYADYGYYRRHRNRSRVRIWLR